MTDPTEDAGPPLRRHRQTQRGPGAPEMVILISIAIAAGLVIWGVVELVRSLAEAIG